jgi:glycosyl transferase family 87
MRYRPRWSAGRVWKLVLLAVLLGLPLALLARRALSGYGTGPLPYDLTVFLRAADDVLAGRSPFPSGEAFTSDASYVYPPLLAIAAIPLAVLPVAAAVLIWTTLAVTAVGAALWLLDVRDWRVYGLALLLPATRDAVGGGSIGPFLVLATAVAWRYRDRKAPMAATAIGLAAALKLFVWPLIAWFAATRRWRAALVAIAVGGGAMLASWAVIGFRGLGEYPAVLRRLTDLEAKESYSVLAVGQALGLSTPLSVVLSLTLGAIFLAVMVRAAGDVRRTASERDRVSLTAAIAASLAITPILWNHYLVLLVVPLALARPRLSPLWLVPLVPSAFEVLGWNRPNWPSGDVPSLVIVLGTAVLALGLMLRGHASGAGTGLRYSVISPFRSRRG